MTLVKHLDQAARYDAPNHFDVRSLRLQGFEKGGPEAFWMGLSYFLPEGGAGPDSGALEKVYIVLSGQLTLRAEGKETILGPMDSVCIPGGVVREIKNEGKEVVTMLVVMPQAPKA
jgi:quercetin dioxygenase-like cupin family protein